MIINNIKNMKIYNTLAKVNILPNSENTSAIIGWCINHVLII